MEGAGGRQEPAAPRASDARSSPSPPLPTAFFSPPPPDWLTGACTVSRGETVTLPGQAPPDALCPPPGAPRTKRCCGHICIEQGFLLHPPLEPDSLMEGQRPAQHPLPPPELTATRFSLLVSEPQGQGWAQLSPPSKPLQTPLMGETLPLPQDAHTGGKQPPSHAPRWLHDCGVTCPLEASMPTSEMGDKQPTSRVGSGCQ